MAEKFDVSTWKSEVAAWWRDKSSDLPRAMRQLGVRTSYGLLAASAWLPLLAAYSSDPGPAVAALAGVLSGVGTNLLSNLVQGAYDEATAPQQAEQEVAEQPDLRAEYQQMLAALDVVAAAQDALGDDWAAFEAELRAEVSRLGGSLHIESGGGAVVLGDVRVKYGDFIGRDQVINVYPSQPKPDLTPLREAYLRHVADRCERLPLRGVDVQAGDATARPERPCLAHVYVDLDTTTQMGKEELKKAQQGEFVEMARRAGEPGVMALSVQGRPGEGKLSALAATRLFRHLVLLGAPGSGKSTFVRHLAFCLAMAQLEPEAGWLAHLPGWPETEAEALPVVVILRDFARWAAAQEREQKTAGLLADFVAARLADHDLADFAGPLREALRQGQAIVLLDGLDEVPSRELRGLVRDAVADFARIYEPARILVTCRTFSYQDPAWQLDRERFPAVELAPFDEAKIDAFIEAWYEELANLRAVRPQDTGALAARLRQAVRRPDLWRLAPNPLLLTVMALVHAHRGRLPEARALLYEECTDLLLWRWEQVKRQVEGEDLPGLRQLLADASLQDVDLKQVLWALAFEAQAASGEEEDREATADIPETGLLRALRGLHPQESWDWAAAVVTQIKERAGLLLEREPEVYAFPHRTFQEYLAGCHLSVQAEFAQEAAALAQEAAFWREVVLLAVGRQVHVSGDVGRPLTLAAELCPPEAPAGDAGWQQAWLAGEVLLDVGVERAGRSALGRELLARVRERLAALVGDGYLQPRERAEAGDVLGRLGDPRPGVGVARDSGLPAIVWVEVPAGSFVMGSREDDREAYDDEKPQQRLELPYRYWLARYPTTVAQYRCFVDDGGYEEAHWWTETGWAWRRGKWDSQVEDRTYRDWLGRRPAELRDTPMWWDEQREHPTRPVMGVNWFEAVAFCRWLNDKWQAAGCELRVWRNGRLETRNGLFDKYQARLPTEAEWAKAAWGQEGRRYAWGDEDWEPQRANIQETIGRVTPVGMYPQGATPSGLLDLTGNVWEWTASLYRPYPYQGDDAWNDPEAEGARVLRGGSWYDIQRNARCAFRSRYIPGHFFYDVGLRVVVSLASSDF